jgi:hypothetical protein
VDGGRRARRTINFNSGPTVFLPQTLCCRVRFVLQFGRVLSRTSPAGGRSTVAVPALLPTGAVWRGGGCRACRRGARHSAMLGKRERHPDCSPSGTKRLATGFDAAPVPKEIATLAQGGCDALCPICRTPLVSRCTLCQMSHPDISPCVLSAGACGCAYHTHCLEPWILRRDCCPVHDSPWVPCAPSLAQLRALNTPAQGSIRR